MKIRTYASVSLILVVLFSTSCNLSSRGNQNNTGPVPTPDSSPLPITDYTRFYQQQVSSGAWTPEKGLVTMFKLFAGEIKQEDAGIPSTLTTREDTGLFILAAQYLQKGKNAATKSELTRLIQVIAPTQATLNAYSVPDEAMENKPAGLAAPIHPDTSDCAGLWSEGFPDTRTPSYPCFQYNSQTIGGNDYRVYLPLAWRGDSSRLAYYAAVRQSIADTVPVYSRFGVMRSIYFVFSLLPNADDAATDATTFFSFVPGVEGCPILIHPPMLVTDIPYFKQVMAHEMFHCFQFWNLHDQIIGPEESASQWWFESTPEYFSNLVYPATNAEYHTFLASLIDNSLNHQMTELSYENFLFFQYLANLRHADGVIAFLRTLPTSGDVNTQLAALSATPGMETIFQGYARDFIDNRILDTSGAVYPYTVSFWTGMASNRSQTIHYKSFALIRYKFTFPLGSRYTTRVSFADSLSSLSSEAYSATSAWTSFPYSFDVPCSEQVLKLSVVSTIGDKGRYGFQIDMTGAPSPCTDCLTGAWNLDNSSYGPFFLATFAHISGPLPVLNDVTGKVYLEFNGHGLVSGGYDTFTVDYTPQLTGVADTSSLRTQIILQGSGTGNYSASTTNIISLTDSNFSITTQILMGGAPVSIPTGVDTGLFSSPIADQSTFACEGNELKLIFPFSNNTRWPPLIWNRVSP